MGFIPVKSDNGAVLPTEYMPAATGDYAVGAALKVDGGNVANLDAALKTNPPYICMGEKTISNAGDLLPVQRVSHDVIYETALTAAATSAKIGTKLEVSSGGAGADATATGSFELTALYGTGTGDIVRGRFV